MQAVRKENAALSGKLDSCMYVVRTIFVKLRSRQPMDAEDNPQACADDGKSALRDAYARLKPTFGPQAPAALTDWRLEWLTAFDAAIPQAGEREREYLRRYYATKAALSRATNKLELATE